MNLIVACDANYNIGYNNDILFHFQKDLKDFKEKTLGNIVVMGRKTWNSLNKKLPERTNIVMTNNKENVKGIPDEIINDFNELSEYNNIWVIGGSEIYKSALEHDLINYISLTWIYGEKMEADTDIKFLENYLSKFKFLNKAGHFDKDKKTNNHYAFDIIEYEKSPKN